MFVLQDTHEFDWPVEISMPAGINGDGTPRWESHTITARFKALPLADAMERLAVREGQAGEPLLNEALIGWDGVGGEDGEPLPFSDENRRRLLGVGYVATAVLDAYLEAIAGRPRKN